ncbi:MULTISPECIES: hypothetical protein [Psychrobacter]|jgi:hypothetical protein|uniref:hypothetical protein n=2 Tax=Gammaproteobacteria TaxID=1236 RepID=UPI000472EB94|nr:MULTISPECIES: hypothetical protein [Psychrobacter]
MSRFLAIFVSIDFLKIFIPAIIAIATAFYSHQSAVKLQINEQKSEQRIDHLKKSFKSLLMYSSNPNKEEAAKHLRDASISIQFMGTKWQVEQMQQLIDSELGTGDSDFSFDPLIASLRDELRESLDLEELEGKVYWVHPIHNELSKNKSQQ